MPDPEGMTEKDGLPKRRMVNLTDRNNCSLCLLKYSVQPGAESMNRKPWAWKPERHFAPAYFSARISAQHFSFSSRLSGPATVTRSHTVCYTEDVGSREGEPGDVGKEQ